MKTVTTGALVLVLLGTAWLAAPAAAKDSPPPQLVDMYAKAEGDHYKIHIVASGDISQYKSTRKLESDSYKLTLDVPALPPFDSKYDIDTPFSKRFEVWPMKLGKQLYSRIVIVLDLEASSVIGQDNPYRIFVTISRKSAAMVAGSVDEAENPTPSPGSDEIEMRSQTSETSEIATVESPVDDPAYDPTEAEQPPYLIGEGESPTQTQELSTANEASAPIPANASLEETSQTETDSIGQEFFSLFPVPAGGRRPIFDVSMDLGEDEALYDGVRLGRLLFQPVVYASWIEGSNLLLTSDGNFKDSALYLRLRAPFRLMHSAHLLKFAYELRYRDFKKYELNERWSHLFDFGSTVNLSPKTRLHLGDRFVQGSTESVEYDPGREIAFADEAFLRNTAHAGIEFDFSERLGLELYGDFHNVHFLEPQTVFYDYNVRHTGAGVLYRLSPLSTLFGQYERIVTPEPIARPEAASTADTFWVGMRGEITPFMTGRARGGYMSQVFGAPGEELNFQGLVADIELVRYFSEKTALTFEAGRRTSPSNYESNGYFKTGFISARFVTPVWGNFRLLAAGQFLNNDYPLDSAEIGAPRADNLRTGSLGLAYYFTRRGFFQVDYLHEQRNSNIARFEYRNNVLQFLVGWGFQPN